MPALAFDSLTRRYGSARGVSDLTLAVEEGAVFGLLGPNGAGKTTALSCALGLLRPDRGRAEVLGIPSVAIHRTRGRVGVVFDGATLVGALRVEQNLEYARRLFGHRGGRDVDEVLERTGILPLKGRRAGKLSLGQKKRLAIARALLGSPELLILDEPLSGLDTVGVRSMLELIRQLAQEGLTLVLSSHRLFEMQRVITHAGILIGGKLVRAGSMAELLGERAGRYRLSFGPGPDPGAFFEGTEGVGGLLRVRRDAAQADAWEVQLNGLPPAELNRRLVEGGFAVSSLVPVGADLPALFEELVDAHAGEDTP